jgi:hypothetical protein
MTHDELADQIMNNISPAVEISVFAAKGGVTYAEEHHADFHNAVMYLLHTHDRHDIEFSAAVIKELMVRTYMITAD